MSWYNEIDPAKAEWLRQLMAHGVIEQGTVDERSITEIKPHELEADTCHFFAGIGIWQYALQLAGWTGPVWTGSCPCTPFSVAGQRKGQADERHLWPAWFRLITERRPVTIFGEQVSDGDGQAWLDDVQVDLESMGYRIGSLTLPAASVGAPHGRHRTFFVADMQGKREGAERGGSRERILQSNGNGSNGIMADTESQLNRSGNGRARRRRESSNERNAGELGNAAESGRSRRNGTSKQKQGIGDGCTIGDVGNSKGDGRGESKRSGSRQERFETQQDKREGAGMVVGPVNGFWADAEWIPCRGKIPGTTDWRPIKPSVKQVALRPSANLLPLCDYGFPLVKGAEARALRLKGYGDGIVVQVAVEFIKAYMSLK